MIILEIGLNHLGKEDYADEYIEQVLKSRADALTFQIREKEYYQREEKKHLKLNNEYYKKAADRTRQAGKKFGIAISDQDMIDFFESLNTDFYKVLSKDLANYSLIDKLVRTNKPVFVSTGTSSLEEIENLVKQFNVRLIHTQLSYDLEDVNLAVIPFLREKFNIPVAFGSHCPNKDVLILSLAYKPSDIFFYIKGDRKDSHPDEDHAVYLKDLDKVIDSLIELPKTIGKPQKIKMNNLIKDQI